MRALILAAGAGTRMGKYTVNLPKGMLAVNGKTLIERQIEKFRSVGLADITIVTGYRSEAINYPGVRCVHNPDYAETNMIESMMRAREIMDADILVSYSDIVYTRELLKATAESPAAIAVAVDADWRAYWKLRFGTTEADLETLSVGKDGRITELGKPVGSSEGIDYRYIGLLKFSRQAVVAVIELYETKKSKNESWQPSGKSFRQGYMTDLLNELIRMGIEVRPVVSHGGWLEFDRAEDYELIGTLEKAGKTAGLFE